MGIVAVPLDGQNVGFQLTGGTLTVNLFTLDIASGAITSSYLSAEQLRNLQPAVTELFSLVPLADRPAGALGLLSRIVAVSAADASSVSLGVVPAGPTSGTYQATVGATPAYLVMHLPYSADGNIAWAAGSGGGGVTAPVTLANGGLGQDVSAFKGLVAISGGTSGAIPLIGFNVSSGAEAGNKIKVTITAYNVLDGSAYSLANPMKFWLENMTGTFTISQGGGYKGGILFDNLASNRRALLRTDNNGVCEIDVSDALAETITLGFGGGPAAGIPNNGQFIGSSSDITFT